MSEEEKQQLPPAEGVSSAEETQEVTPPEECQQETKQQEETQPPVEQKKEEDEDLSKVDTTDDAQVAEVLNHKGFDLNKLQDEFDTNGDITAATRKELEKVGITKEILDSYIEGRYALVEKQMNEIAESIGGKETFENVCNWARANLSDEEKAVYDGIHDPALIKIALRDLKNRMENSDGVIPHQIQGGSNNASGDYFQSMAEVEDAINDPKYSKDEVYRQKVAQKISASREAGYLELK